MLGYHLKKNVKPIVKHPFFAFIVFGLVLILLQILSWTAGFPKSSAMSGIATVLIYSIVGFGFTYLLGYAGLASLGTAGFTGLGAYIVGYFLRETGVPYIVSILVVLAVSIILGVAVGFISLRIEGIFLAIVTLGLSEILYQIFTNWIDFTGGPNGSSASIPIFQKWLGLSTTTSKRAMFIVLVVVVVFSHDNHLQPVQKQHGTRHARHEKQHVGGAGDGHKFAQIQTARFRSLDGIRRYRRHYVHELSGIRFAHKLDAYVLPQSACRSHYRRHSQPVGNDCRLLYRIRTDSDFLPGYCVFER